MEQSAKELQKEVGRLRRELEAAHESLRAIEGRADRGVSRSRRASVDGLVSQPRALAEPPKQDDEDIDISRPRINHIVPVLVPKDRWKGFFRPKNKLQLSQGTGRALIFELDLQALGAVAPTPRHQQGSSVSNSAGDNCLEAWLKLLLQDKRCVRERWYPLCCSPLSALTLRQEEREGFGIPSRSCWFCYSYPVEALSSILQRNASAKLNNADMPLVLWLLYGAFVYFDAKLEVLTINAISFHQRAPLSFLPNAGGGGYFRAFPLRLNDPTRSRRLRALTCRFLKEWGRWASLPVAPATIEELKAMLEGGADAGAEEGERRLAWINPSEVLGDDCFSMFGGFALAEGAGEEEGEYFAIDPDHRLEAELANSVQAVNADIARTTYTSSEASGDEGGGEEEEGSWNAATPASGRDALQEAESAASRTTLLSPGKSVPTPDSASPASPASPASALRRMSCEVSFTHKSQAKQGGGLWSAQRVARSRSSVATVTGLIDVSMPVAEQLQYALRQFKREREAEEGSDGGERGGKAATPSEKDPSTWTEEYLQLPETQSPSGAGAERRALAERVRFLARLHLKVGLPLRVPVPIKLLALQGFGAEQRLPFKDFLWAQDKYDLGHTAGNRVLFHLSVGALLEEDAKTQAMLRGAFREVGALMDNATKQRERKQTEQPPLLTLRAGPLCTVTLPEMVRVKAGIPSSAVNYAFCYPLDCSLHVPSYCACHLSEEGAAPPSPSSQRSCPSAGRRARVSISCPAVQNNELLTLLLRGGFLYFDEVYDIVAVNAWTSDEHASSKNLLHFGPSVALPWSADAALEACGRWRDVTHDAADTLGFEKMAWVNPHEVVADLIFSRYGGLAFRRHPKAGRNLEEEAGERGLGAFFPIVVDSADCHDPAAYEQHYAPKHYDMALDFPVFGGHEAEDSALGSKFGSSLTRAASAHVHNLVQFHEETKKSALGIKSLFGQERTGAGTPLEQIRAEFVKAREEEWATDEDVRNMEYVLDEAAAELEVKDNTGAKATVTRDEGNQGLRLEDFWKKAEAQEASLEMHEVAALRLYTTASFKLINDPLREQRLRDESGQHGHPLPATTRYIYEALKKMRAVHLEAGSRFKTRYLWRGLRNLQVDEVFLSHGGTELACMSTSEDINIVARYCQCNEPLVFRIRVASPMDLGADISWLSCFPHEKEVLYPPLTYLKPLYKQKMKTNAKGSVITVEVRFPS